MRLVPLISMLAIIECTRTEGKDDPVDRLVIVVQPVGDEPRASLDTMRAALARGHQAVVHLLAPLQLPAIAFTEVRAARYRADTLIARLSTVTVPFRAAC